MDLNELELNISKNIMIHFSEKGFEKWSINEVYGKLLFVTEYHGKPVSIVFKPNTEIKNGIINNYKSVDIFLLEVEFIRIEE